MHLITVQDPFQMLVDRENHFVRSMKENFVTVVILRIVKMTELGELKLIRNIVMTSINIDSLELSQAWLVYVEC